MGSGSCARFGGGFLGVKALPSLVAAGVARNDDRPRRRDVHQMGRRPREGLEGTASPGLAVVQRPYRKRQPRRSLAVEVRGTACLRADHGLAVTAIKTSGRNDGVLCR